MTREEIENMEAGRELDALIAIRVMGWVHIRTDEYGRVEGVSDASTTDDLWNFDPVPCYSTDIAAAWQVVEKLAVVAGPTSICWGIYGGEGDKASVMTMYGDGPGVVAPTAPLAICRAALLAVMES